MTPTKLPLSAAAAILLLAACGSDDGADTAPAVVIEGIDTTPQTTTAAAAPASETDSSMTAGEPADEAIGATSDEQNEEDQARAFAQCMRDEGVGWPDPTVRSDGSIDLLAGQGPAVLRNTSAEAAINVCGELIAGASFLPGGGDGIDTETRDRLLEFTQCLRDNGIDVDDPDFDRLQPGGGGRGGGGLLGDFDPQDPANADAVETCQSLFAGAIGGAG